MNDLSKEIQYTGSMHIIWIIRMKEADMWMNILNASIGNLWRNNLKMHLQQRRNCDESV